MNNSENLISVEKKINKVVLICFTIIVLILSLAYFTEMIKGDRPLIEFLIIMLIFCGTWVFSFVVYKKNEESSILKHIVGVGYGIGYFYIILTTTSASAFAIMFPIAALSIIYMEPKIFVNLGIISFLMNVIDVYYQYNYLNLNTAEDVAVYKTQFATILLLCIFAYFNSKVLNEINRNKIEDLNVEKAKTEDLLEEIVSRTEIITENIDRLDNQSNELNDNSSAVKLTMDEILDGAKDTTNTVQSQLEMTQEVSEKINTSFEMSNKISEGFNETRDKASLGMNTMKDLNKSAMITNESSKTVNSSVNVLIDKMSDVYKIVDLINSIADQTRLLSLNASIEAARAGEAGKGFAVVAGEIQQLAANTTEATSEIQSLLDELHLETSKANKAVEKLNEASEEQYNLIELTSKSFQSIMENIISFTEDINIQSELMKTIQDDNIKLTNSIDQFSSFSEELLTSTENSKHVIDEAIISINSLSDTLKDTMRDVEALKEKTVQI